MTDAELVFLKSQIDQVVALETTEGERLLAQVLFVFDEGDTPDMFYLRVEPGPDGAYVQQGSAGYSLLLSDVAGVRPPVE
ncbi:MAG TPA: hypothetical protein VK627_04685 [Edaphobacter sp.]|jgi:hypothetical protein|nr:hypothetical protein [Edaphobacter sp.]